MANAREGAPAVDWTVRPLTALVEFGSNPDKADATVTGTHTALWAWTWGRSDEDHRVVIVGDQEVAHEVRGLLARAQQ